MAELQEHDFSASEHGVLEYGVPFGNEQAVISASTDSLRKDTIEEAIRQGIDPKLAESAANNVTYSMGTWKEFVTKNPDINALFKPILQLKMYAPLAIVYPHKNGKIDCHINIEYLVGQVRDGKKVGSFQTPKEASKEGKQMILNQAVQKVWNHERQHIIQLIDPEKKKGLESAMNRRSVLHKAAIGTVLLNAPIVLYSMNLHTREGMIVSLISGTAVAGASVASMVYQSSQDIHSDHEREAYHKMNEETNGYSPFSVTFEKP